jgi:hypothetical protein
VDDARRPDDTPPPEPDATGAAEAAGTGPPEGSGAEAPTGAAPEPGAAEPDTEQRPLGALAVTVFLTVTILVMWFGMYALNMVRS